LNKYKSYGDGNTLILNYITKMSKFVKIYYLLPVMTLTKERTYVHAYIIH